ncbi:MAG: dihydrolipoyl dehydrogenase [Syntrophaceae bacterium]|nr:dihydrolipoyl dehydrogenase [Syntrophaceae bacterium]
MDASDVVVIGGGPAGYSAAVRASQLGLKTALVEKEHLGGVCLNWGCIPTKSLLANAEVAHQLRRGKSLGISGETVEADYAAAFKRSRDVVARQTRRIASLLKNHQIRVVSGTGRLQDRRRVTIEESGDVIEAKHIIIATGSRPRTLPGLNPDGEKILSFRQALAATTVPGSVVIIGAGPIGMEFATLWNRYGSRVTVIELLPRVLPQEDEAISGEAARQFTRNGITLRTAARVEKVETTPAGAAVRLSLASREETVEAEQILVAVGFRANSEDLGLEALGVETSNGAIVVDERMATNIPGIHAIGDVNAKLCLAHAASAQAMIAAEAIAGFPTRPLAYAHIPRCTFSSPEVASAGWTEQECRRLGLEIKTSQCPYAGNGKALAMDDNSGFVKLIAETGTLKLLGVHLIGGHVAELIAGPAALLHLGADARQLGACVHPHPSLSEAIMEAAHALCGHAIHL